MIHLDENTVLAFVEGELDLADIVSVDAHVARCADCRHLIVALAKDLGHEGDAIGAGTLLGRYILLYRIGHGAMGMVFSAYDPELDRKVAIKILRTDLAAKDVEQANARLVREGRAVARLAHPNVVTVHDVGTHEHVVFIAMEEVIGTSLVSWCRAEERSLFERVEIMLQAGEGLAAAHRSGLIHRDFKPANILVGDDGRARVGDFGLARLSASVAQEGSGGLDAQNVSLTHTGALLGTPRYMAPELLSGEAASEISDQYSFAISTWEVLHGEHPFDADSMAQILEAIERGPVATGEGSAMVPASIRRVLKRALAVKSSDRYASVDALLMELRRAINHKKKVVRGALVGGLVISAMVLSWGSLQGWFEGKESDVALCDGAAARLVGGWDAEQVRQAAEQFSSMGAAASETFQRVRGHLDQYRSEWLSAHRLVCEATYVHHEQSDSLFDVRMQCLGTRRKALQASVLLLTEGLDQRVLTNAVAVASGLPSLSACDDIERLLAAEPIPTDPQARREVERALGRIQEAEALSRAGKFSESLAVAREAREVGGKHSYASLEAKSLFVVGNAQSNLGALADSENSLLDSASFAARGRDDETAAKAWTLLVGVVGYLSGRPKEGVLLARMAGAVVSRIPNNEILRSELLSMRGLVMDGMGRYEEAKTFHMKALAIRESNMPADSLDIAVVLDNLGAIPYEQGEYAEAEEIYRKALSIRRNVLGPAHPDVAASLNGLGAVQAAQGNSEAARDSYANALSIWRSTLGSDHPNIAAVLNNLANLVSSVDDYPAAEAYLLEALLIWQKIYDGPHANIAKGLANLGIVLFKQGKLAGAEARLLQAIEMQETLLGRDHPDLVSSLEALTKVLAKQGRDAETRVLLQRSSEITQGMRSEKLSSER